MRKGGLRGEKGATSSREGERAGARNEEGERSKSAFEAPPGGHKRHATQASRAGLGTTVTRQRQGRTPLYTCSQARQWFLCFAFHLAGRFSCLLLAALLVAVACLLLQQQQH